MRIIRYQPAPVFSPAANFSGLREEMDRLFDVAFPSLQSAQSMTTFPIDLYRDKESFVVRAELPGFRREDLSVEVADGVLTVTGHVKPGTEEKDGTDARPERRVSRSISLPEEVRVDGIVAKYENGVLTVTLPKQEEAKPRQIKVDIK